MPENYPGINFNDEGICNFCLDYQPPKKALGKDKLMELISSVEKRGKYDCVVPLSGGKDSAYILYYAVKELNLKPIAVNYNSGFQNQMAKDNMKSACEILGVPLIIKKSKGDVSRKMIREALLMSEIGGSFISRTCGNCEIMLRSLTLNVAKEYKVPFIFWGSSSLESLNYRRYRSGRTLLENIKGKISKFIELKMTPFKLIRIAPHFIKFCFLSIYQRIIMGVPLEYALHPTRVIPFSKKNPQYVHFYDYVEWDSIRGIDLLKSATSWQHPEGKFTRFDCLIHCFELHHSLHRDQISTDGITYCNCVRLNKMDRKDALQQEEYITSSVKGECKAVIDGLNLTKFKMPGKG